MSSPLSAAQANHAPVLGARTGRPSKAIRGMIGECQEISRTPAGDTHRIAVKLQEMIIRYYGDVRWQAQQSFVVALVVASVGALFLGYAIWLSMSPDASQQVSQQALLSSIAGVLIQFIAGVNFYLYFRAGRQFASFHVCLERTNRFLIANSLCEQLSEPARDEMRSELLRIVATAPMLTVDLVTGEGKDRTTTSMPQQPNPSLQPTGSARG